MVGGVFAVNFFPELHLRFETAGNGKVILTQGLGSLRGGGQGRGERVERNYKDGKLDGLGTGWYDNGNKKYEGTYKDGKPDGLWTYWYENGQKKSEVTYKNGKKNGKWTTWYKDGTKIREV